MSNGSRHPNFLSSHHLGYSAIGDGYTGPVPLSIWPAKIFAHSHRLLYQVSRSKILGIHHQGQGPSFLLDVNHLSVRAPPYHCHHNSWQFNNQVFKELCAKLHILHRFTSIGHPQINGEAKVMKRAILQGLRTRLDEVKGRWAEELPSMLWVYHTTPGFNQRDPFQPSLRYWNGETHRDQPIHHEN